MSAAAGELETSALSIDDEPHVGVVLASGGYPDAYDTGKAIHGLDAAEACRMSTSFTRERRSAAPIS